MQSSKRKRRIVEIYFILYLAALVFILPESSFKPGGGNGPEVIGDFQTGFTLIPEKSALVCNVVVEPNGYRITKIDSSNVIFYTGDFEDIQFEFTVEDQSTNRSVTLRPDKNYSAKYFRVVEVPEKKAAVFYWRPQYLDNFNTTYLVKVVATAKSKKTFGTKYPERFTYKATAQFTLLIVLMNAVTGEQTIAQGNQQTPQFPLNILEQTQQIPTGFGVGKISVNASTPNVTQLAYQQWANTINATNVNLASDAKIDLIARPEPENNGGTAQISEIKPDYLVIRGRTPGYGRLNIELVVKRKFDGQEARTSFVVVPQQIEKPIFKEFIYPGQTDTIDPRLPLIGGELKTLIKDGNRIRASSIGGAPIYFTPELSDTGKQLTLERYIDNNLLGQVYTIYVLNFPLPKIVDVINTGNRVVEIVTQAFGVFNRERNEIVRLELEGNVAERYIDLRGKLQDFYGNPPYRRQNFQLKPKDQGKPFVFVVTAVDKYGRRSAPRRVVAD
ncbi:MAG: hypothetical protein N2560_05565 [Ignavibacteria bacterium]|nr:hypothetical protein [Ignavibacteria bacterium]